jgi:hypothetical protein
MGYKALQEKYNYSFFLDTLQPVIKYECTTAKRVEICQVVSFYNNNNVYLLNSSRRTNYRAKMTKNDITNNHNNT